MNNIKYILTDIEGTTTSISFVVDMLFPYFVQHIDELRELKTSNQSVEACFAEIEQTLLQEHRKPPITDDDIIEQLKEWVQEDKKEPSLKTLQGIIWAKGYSSGKVKGHLYSDVPDALRKWKSEGVALGVYSSGSVAAQKLLFGHSEYGDLCPLFSHYFDTAVGHKRDVSSYTKILEALHLPGSQVLFLSDIEQELDAAQAAGMQTTQLVRPGTKACKHHRHASDFSEVALQLS